MRIHLGITMTAALSASTMLAAVKPIGIFTDNMVLPRGKQVPVWGRATPGEKVSVSYSGKTATATTGADGRFEAVLPALDVEKNGKELKIVGTTGSVVCTNVVVGDVWLVSGQSNAEMSFRWGILDGAAEMRKSSAYPNVRQLKFSHVTSAFIQRDDSANVHSRWVVCNEDTLPNVSAMGYFFARDINMRTGIPIGILDDNWSGCRIEPFVNEEGLGLVPEFSNGIRQTASIRKRTVEWAHRVAEAEKTGDFGGVGFAPPMPDWGGQYNAMIAPLVRFPITGALWYQGCSNGGEGMEYKRKLEALIGGWRKAWGYDFPFYVVQLAAFTQKTTDPAGGNGYARIRNAMRIAAQTIPNTGLAVAIDIGNASDIHPKNKRDVGERLARWARRDVYGEKGLVVSGPLFRGMKVVGSKVRIAFDHVGSGLMAGEKGPDTPGVAPTPTPDGRLRGFAVAGADKKWHWADAAIDGNDVVVSSKEVAAPVAVRYAHRGNPMGDCNLYNREGLPASPFRTDDW